MLRKKRINFENLTITNKRVIKAKMMIPKVIKLKASRESLFHKF